MLVACSNFWQFIIICSMKIDKNKFRIHIVIRLIYKLFNFSMEFEKISLVHE